MHSMRCGILLHSSSYGACTRVRYDQVPGPIPSKGRESDEDESPVGCTHRPGEKCLGCFSRIETDATSAEELYLRVRAAIDGGSVNHQH